MRTSRNILLAASLGAALGLGASARGQAYRATGELAYGCGMNRGAYAAPGGYGAGRSMTNQVNPAVQADQQQVATL